MMGTHRYLSRLVFVLLLTLCLAPNLWQPSASAAEKLTKEQVAALLPQLFKLHLKQGSWDVPFVKRLLKKYVNELDPMKSFYTKQEVEDIVNLSDVRLKALADQSSNGDFTYYTTLLKGFLDVQIGRDHALYDGLEGRVNEINAIQAKEKLKLAARNEDKGKPVDSNTTEAPQAKDEAKKDIAAPTGIHEPAQSAENDEDPDQIKWTERAANDTERETRLLKAISVYFESNKAYLCEREAFKQALLTVREERDKWMKVSIEQEVPKLFLKSFMDAMDPHTNYFDAEEDGEFTERLEREFAGIGVQIRPCPLGAQVEDIIKGGPSEKSSKFARGDQIIAVDDFPLAGMPINKIVRKIKGEKGTQVTLRLLKRDTQQNEVIVLTRDTIQVADMKVKGKKFETPAGTIGLISVQTFYRGVHKDVRERIKELSMEKPLVGIVLDLRDNHGGYLDEAVGLAGLFINSGPVVGERDCNGNVDWRKSSGSAAFAGPMAVLTNQFSASASEIVAGTLKDYARVVIVAPTQTFGKGTVQRVIPLNPLNYPGEIKITTHQYFLAGGDSVQLRGVLPDVIIPGPKLLEEEGYLERASENAIGFNSIPGELDRSKKEVRLWTDWKSQNMAMLQEKSKQRVDANPEFKNFFNAKLRKAKAAAAREEKPLKPDEAPPLSDPNEEKKDPQADEAVSVVKDMIGSWPGTEKQAAR